MKKLILALISVCTMLTLSLYAYADVPALPREPEKNASGLIVLLVVVVILIGGAILAKLLRKKK